MKQLRANLDFPVHFKDVRGLRAHLHNSVTGAIAGVLSGFDGARQQDRRIDQTSRRRRPRGPDMTELRKKHGSTLNVSVTSEDGTVLEQFVVVHRPFEGRLASVIRQALDESDIACFDTVGDADEFYTELEAELTEGEGAD